MHSRLNKLNKLLLLVTLPFSLSSCGGQTVVKDFTACQISGLLSAGGVCVHRLNVQKDILSFDSMLSFLEARGPSPDPNNPGQLLPAHAAAVSLSAHDYGEVILELDEMCRQLGSRCSPETQATVAQGKALLNLK